MGDPERAPAAHADERPDPFGLSPLALTAEIAYLKSRRKYLMALLEVTEEALRDPDAVARVDTVRRRDEARATKVHELAPASKPSRKNPGNLPKPKPSRGKRRKTGGDGKPGPKPGGRPAPPMKSGVVLEAIDRLSVRGGFHRVPAIARDAGMEPKLVSGHVCNLHKAGWIKRRRAAEREKRTGHRPWEYRSNGMPNAELETPSGLTAVDRKPEASSVPPAPALLPPAEQVRRAMERLGSWATADEIHEEIGADRPKWWTLAELRRGRESGDYEHRCETDPHGAGSVHLYRIWRDG